MIFTIVGAGLLAVVLVSVFIRRNEMRTAAITLLSVYLALGMAFGYTAARHRAVDIFDKYGEQIARQMMAGVDAYYNALADLRVGIALASLGLLVLAVSARHKREPLGGKGRHD